MKRLLMPLAFMAVISMGMAAQAGPFGLFARQPVRNTAHVAQHAVQGAVSGATGGIAQAKAETQARQGVMRHVGGSFGAGRYEGVGFSTASASNATLLKQETHHLDWWFVQILSLLFVIAAMCVCSLRLPPS